MECGEGVMWVISATEKSPLSSSPVPQGAKTLPAGNESKSGQDVPVFFFFFLKWFIFLREGYNVCPLELTLCSTCVYTHTHTQQWCVCFFYLFIYILK